jgi:hypothetical protein
MSGIFTNPDQLEEWVEAAEGIEERFGLEKALGYVIGEKFYNLVSTLHAARTMARVIEEEKKKPDYDPIRERKYGNRKYVENLDEIYAHKREIITEAEGLLTRFAFLINQAFEPHHIRGYLESHPRLGIHGHICSEEEYEFMVSKGAIEHSMETEVEDALILGEMMKYLATS